MAPFSQGQSKQLFLRSSKNKFSVSNPSRWISHIAVGIACFQLGFLIGGHSGGAELHCPASEPLAHTLQAAADAVNPLEMIKPAAVVSRRGREKPAYAFPDTLTNMFKGMGRVNRDEFFAAHDLGVPKDPSVNGNQDVLLLYSQNSLPKPRDALQNTKNSMIPLYNASAAVENCRVMKMILTEPKKKNHCIAVVGQWESYHVHKWMRLAQNNATKQVKDPHALQDSNPLRVVSRGHQADGRYQPLPLPRQSKRHWSVLMEYLSSVEGTIKRLEPIAKKVAGKGNDIVVMVCNHGHSELLVNFACSSKARGLDTSNVLVFATDIQTKELAESVGLTVFDVQDSFGKMPTEAAKAYGDQAFTGMMMAKVYCVHLINSLGYDVLFQDVDVVWYKNPLSYFKGAESGDFDMYFQDDGAHSARYAPYSPNSGFYYVRHNLRTEFLFSVFVRMGDTIQVTGSHQAALTSLLAEHSSWRGLKVKTFGRDAADGDEFPGGFHFHRRKEYMKEVATGKRTPYIFHMSWTENKENKQKFFQQLGNWYVNDLCVGKTVPEITSNGTNVKPASELCCSATPLVECHYRDKPSKIPCKKSPPIVKRSPSFW